MSRCAFRACALLLLAPWIARADAPRDDFFNTQVRPILAENCFKCHGPDDKARKAKLRLDDRTAAVGKGAIVPGKPEESELVSRVLSADPEHVMPPPSTKRTLTAAQKDILKRWVAAGAEYAAHWAFVKPTWPPVPAVAGPGRNPIDA